MLTTEGCAFLYTAILFCSSANRPGEASASVTCISAGRELSTFCRVEAAGARCSSHLWVPCVEAQWVVTRRNPPTIAAVKISRRALIRSNPSNLRGRYTRIGMTPVLLYRLAFVTADWRRRWLAAAGHRLPFQLRRNLPRQRFRHFGGPGIGNDEIAQRDFFAVRYLGCDSLPRVLF